MPITSSLSISLGKKGTFTFVEHINNVEHVDNVANVEHITNANNINEDIYIINGQVIPPQTKFAKSLRSYLDLFRPTPQTFYRVKSISTIPIAAGLASSASGYAALILALNDLYDWHLPARDLSRLARLGSGSACRSLWHGFVEWQKGNDTSYTNDTRDGGDDKIRNDGIRNIDNVNTQESYAAPLPDSTWNELRIGIILISSQTKEISSRQAMQHTVATSPPYAIWSQQAERDFITLKHAIATRNFELLGTTSEHNSLLMHALMQSARPPIVYTQPATLAAMHRVWDMRRANIPVFFTQDAGPNLKLLFQAKHTHIVTQAFPDIDIIAPFSANATQDEQLTLVDDDDCAIGIGEKMATHLIGQLHRAFSVIIFRKRHINNFATKNNENRKENSEEQSKEHSQEDNEGDGKEKEVNEWEEINEGNREDASITTIEVLLQQRSACKYHSPNLWTNTCCGHQRPHEDTLNAAKRRLDEEMGIKITQDTADTANTAIQLREIGTFHYRTELSANGLIENEIDHVVAGEWKEWHTTPPTKATASTTKPTIAITPKEQEVQNYCWFEINALLHDLEINPRKYTVWLSKVLEKLQNYKLY